MHWEARFRDLAAVQEGVVGRDQLPSIGCDWDHWGRAQSNGRWLTPTPRTLILDGAPPTPGQRAHAAIQDAGGCAALHGGSALAWFGLRGYDLSTIHVARRRRGRSRPSMLATVHRLRDLRHADVAVVRGVPTVTPLRAIWSEASRFSNERWHHVGLVRIGRLLDDAHRAGLVRWDELHRSVHDLQRRGRAGTRLLRDLAEHRLPGTSPTESRNEDRLESILADAGLPAFERQRVVGGDGPIGRVDHRHPDLPLVVETNSLTFHTTPSDQRDDEARYDALVRAGFSVAVVWEDDLWSHVSGVVAAVRDGIDHARSDDPVIIHSSGCPWDADAARRVAKRFVPATRG